MGQKKESCIGITQENSIESSLQDSLPYIPIHMVCASYCASYPKWPCIRHKVNMWYTCCVMSLLLEPSTPFPYISWSVTITMTNHHSNPNPRVIKIENENKSKREWK